VEGDQVSEYIKREAVLGKVVVISPEGNYGSDQRVVYAGEIESIPAADVEPVVRGEWVQKTITERSELFEEEFEIPVIVCSVCDTIVSFPSSYCPECGAHMERSGSGE